MLVVSVLLCTGCGDEGGSTRAPTPTPLQRLSVSMNPRSVPPPTEQDVLDAIDMAIDAGTTGAMLTYTWSEIEPTPQRYNLGPLQESIKFFTARGLHIYLGIHVINTVKRETPSDLLTVPFDAPQMRTRFRALLDRIQPLVTTNVRYLTIGNEVDVYLEAQPAEWGPYQTFYEDGLAYAHQKMPGVLVGVTATYGGASGPSQTEMARLNTKSDVVSYTYYPLDSDFQVHSPRAPLTDFPNMLTLAGGKPVVLQEVGFPSDPLNASSEAIEAQFVTNALASWQAAGRRMPFLNYFLQHDLDSDTCDLLLRYYGLPDPAFKAYLCSLGLRRADGSPKPAWDSFVAGAK